MGDKPIKQERYYMATPTLSLFLATEWLKYIIVQLVINIGCFNLHEFDIWHNIVIKITRMSTKEVDSIRETLNALDKVTESIQYLYCNCKLI